MKFIEVARKKFKLASRFARLFAFFIDGLLVAGVLSILVFLFDAMGSGIGPSLIQIGLLSVLLWTLGPKTKIDIDEDVLPLLQMALIALFGPWANYDLDTLLWGGTAIGAALLFFMDGFSDGQSPGKKLLSLQVLRLKDGKPCTVKDSFIRRLTSIFQPLDSFWTFGKQRQRMGDKLAETVVVKLDPVPEALETEDPEKILENVILEMTNRLSDARQKVDASIGVEKLFQNAYEGAVAQAGEWHDRAVINLKAGREDLAREDIEKRNEYRRLADQYKTQWEDQKQVVQALSNLLEHLQQKMTEAEGKKAVVVAQHRNVDAESHLREMLKAIQDSKAFETLAKMEQNATEAVTLAKAAAEVDVAYQDAELAREFSGYAEEASIDKDLTELKAKMQQ